MSLPKFRRLGDTGPIIISREEITCCCLVDRKLVSATGYSCEFYIKTGTLPIFEKNLMDSIVRYMLAVFVLDNYFETSCAGILLFVDFENKARICSVHAGLGASKFPWCQWLCG